MTPSYERDANIFSIQPSQEAMSSHVAALMDQFGGRVERLTQRTLSPAERAIVDARLLKLEMDIGKLESDHKAVITQAMLGFGSRDAANDQNLSLAA